MVVFVHQHPHISQQHLYTIARQEHGYGLPARVTGVGATGVWVRVLNIATCTLTHYPRSGLAGEGIFCGVFIIFNCTVSNLVENRPPTQRLFSSCSATLTCLDAIPLNIGPIIFSLHHQT